MRLRLRDEFPTTRRLRRSCRAPQLPSDAAYAAAISTTILSVLRVHVPLRCYARSDNGLARETDFLRGRITQIGNYVAAAPTQCPSFCELLWGGTFSHFVERAQASSGPA